MGFIIAITTIIIIYLIGRRRFRSKYQRKDYMTILLAIIAISLTVSVIMFPEDAFNASVSGLQVWWNIVFPALLPFFIMAQILIGLGVVHMLGVVLEPVMRPVFNVPGTGSFVMAMGLASGFPIGAVLTGQLRRDNLCSKTEAERLLSFTNTADPLFMFGAVAVGMIGYPEVGIIIATAHYASSLTIGLLMRFYKHRDYSVMPATKNNEGLLDRAVEALIKARKKDNRPLGKLLSDAIIRSIETLMLIGGFIILFSVIIKILDKVGIVKMLIPALDLLLGTAGVSTELSPALVSGIFEIDLGCQIAGTSAAPLRDIIIISGAIIAFSGLSVHAQVASIISDTDISIVPYLVARVVHAFLAGLYTALLIGPVFPLVERVAIPVFLQAVPSGNFSFWWERTLFMFQQSLIFMIILALLSFILYISGRIRFTFFRR